MDKTKMIKYILLSSLVLGAGLVVLFIIFYPKGAIPYLPEGGHFDFGIIEEEANVSHSFPIYNKGSSSLLIKKIITSCSCTKAETDKEIIEPGDFTNISIFYKARPLKMQDFVEVSVITNSKKIPVLSFQMNGFIKNKLFWSPSSISLNKRKPSGEILISKNYAKELQIENYTQTNEYFSAQSQIIDKGILFSINIAPDCPLANWSKEIEINCLVDGISKTITIPIYILNK